MQGNHNNRILITGHYDEPATDFLDRNQNQKNALSVSPALVDDSRTSQLRDPIEPSVISTSMMYLVIVMVILQQVVLILDLLHHIPIEQIKVVVLLC